MKKALCGHDGGADGCTLGRYKLNGAKTGAVGQRMQEHGESLTANQKGQRQADTAHTWMLEGSP